MTRPYLANPFHASITFMEIAFINLPHFSEFIDFLFPFIKRVDHTGWDAQFLRCLTSKVTSATMVGFTYFFGHCLFLFYKPHNSTFTHSICTHYSSLSGWPDIFLGSGTLKNQVQNMDLKKAGSKKQGYCYSKRENAAFSWITMTLFFHLAFFRSIFWTWFFLSSRP